MPSSSGSVTAPSCTRPSSVLATASGSSLISFAMKLDQPPFSAAEASQATSNSRVGTALPAKSVTSTESGRIVTISSCPISMALLGVLDERGDVRAEEVLALAEPDHERRVAAGADDDAGLVLVHDEQRERALEAGDDALHGDGQVAGLLEDVADQESRDLGVGLAREARPRHPAAPA